VRTIDHGVLVLDDGKMERTSAEEPESDLPRVEKITAGSDAAPPAPAATIDLPEPAPAPAASEGGAGDMPVAVEAPSGDAPTPAQPPAQALPQPAAAIPLEHVEDPSLAGRPRLAQDGTLIPRPRAAGDPAYGPDPTFPASYAADGTAPTSVPRNREVWPTRRPWRPTLLSRMIQRFRRDDGAK
jgi:hypothetical protein